MTENIEIPAYITDDQKRAFIAQMDAERAKVIEDARPIQDWENRQVDGKGRACKRVYDDHVAKVSELRQRQEAYEASLPKDRQAALEAISKLSIRDLRDVYENDCAARLAFVIIYELADKIEEDVDITDALKWLSRLGRDAVDRLDADMQKVHNIAHQFHDMREVYRA